MKGINELFSFERDNSTSIKVKNNKIFIRLRAIKFSGDTLQSLVQKIATIIDQYKENKNIEVIIANENLIFSDKGVYILFEAVIYYLSKECNFKIKIRNKSMGIFGRGDLRTYLLLKYTNKYIEKEKLIKDFEKKEIERTKFREIVTFQDKKNISKIFTELNSFLQAYDFISEGFKEKFSEILVELIANANEHAKSDCLLDFTIEDLIHKGDHHKCVALNVVIVNYSKILLGDGIKNKLIDKSFLSILKFKEKNSFIQDLRKAYSSHKNFFNDDYKEEDFCNISAFQWRFSGRENVVEKNGGTGLTRVIQFLLESSEANDCYVFSGKKGLAFIRDFLNLSDENGKYVGFNKEKDYFNKPPDKGVLGYSKFFLNGTLYNLTFILPKVGK